MTAIEASRAWFAAASAASNMPAGPERDAAMQVAERLADVWRDAITAEAEVADKEPPPGC